MLAVGERRTMGLQNFPKCGAEGGVVRSRSSLMPRARSLRGSAENFSLSERIPADARQEVIEVLCQLLLGQESAHGKSRVHSGQACASVDVSE